MKVKPPSRQTRTNINTSTRSSRAATSRRGAREEQPKRGRKPKKQDNTKLFIGVGVGVFFLLIIIIAAASSGGSSRKAASSTSSSTKKSKYQLPINVRKKIYAECNNASIRFEEEAGEEMEKFSSVEERRKNGSLVRSKVKTKENNFRVEISKKYRKKYPKATGAFVRDILAEGDRKSW